MSWIVRVWICISIFQSEGDTYLLVKLLLSPAHLPFPHPCSWTFLLSTFQAILTGHCHSEQDVQVMVFPATCAPQCFRGRDRQAVFASGSMSDGRGLWASELAEKVAWVVGSVVPTVGQEESVSSGHGGREGRGLEHFLQGPFKIWKWPSASCRYVINTAMCNIVFLLVFLWPTHSGVYIFCIFLGWADPCTKPYFLI